jgi:polar amino acid transport system permease protein
MTETVRTRRRGPDPRAVRSSAIAIVSTVVVFGLVGWVVVNAPGWPEVQASFFNAEVFWESLPGLLNAFVVIIYLLGFGIPGLGLIDPRTDQRLFGIAALTLVYSAYVSEVYRAGIESIHPSQDAAARSLGLSRFQALRFVIVPQAVRRVIPPLLNDFIGLQKDTVLVSFIGVVEIFRYAQIKSAATYNFTPLVGVALVFIVVTIPLIHLVDWLVARDRRGAPVGSAR